MRRVFGLETEYGFFCRVNGGRLPSRENIISYLFNQTVPGARKGNVFLENGGRFYLDSGFHPEYATPEADQVAELVAHDKAGERIVADLLLRAGRLIHEEGFTGSVLAFKNNTDSVGNSYGCHENYLTRRDVALECLAAGLIPFLVTRQVFTGAGKVLRTIRGSQFCLSQRAQHICQEMSGGTTTARAIINTRDETLADSSRYRRLHLILGDSNMSEVTTYLKVGTTALVIDMIEDGWLNSDYSLHAPVDALRTISRDPTLRATVKLKDGRLLTALEIQNEYLERALRYAQSSGCDSQRRDILGRWTRTIERLEHEPLLLDREVDWVIKLRLMTNLMDRHGISWNDPRLSLLDLQYHDMRSDRSVYHRLVSLGMVERITTDAAVERAMHLPPQTTRARLRGECIRRLRLSGKEYRADWSSLKVLGGEEPTLTIHWRDPLQAHDENTEDLIEKL
ncbi:MAG: proteasome accessory factor PafA2 family protein [Candidatus Rokubacteria bacterium]|nr:proteasome accessory factor PafA2 family protein [Candidatus Rokubacteria bacterium]